MSPTASRRSVLGAAGGAVVLLGVGTLAGCTSGAPGPGPNPSATQTVTADELARRTAAAHETALADIATATAKALRTAPTGPAIAFSATAHQAHAAALLEGLTPAPSRAPAAALTAVALAQAQTAAAARHLTALAGVSGPLARLLASIAASDAALASTVRGVSR